MNTEKAAEIVNRISQIKDKIDAMKPIYEELDDLILELSEAAEVNQTLATNDNRFVTLVDNFADKNTVFRPAAVKRFDVELLTKEELDKKQARLAKKKDK